MVGQTCISWGLMCLGSRFRNNSHNISLIEQLDRVIDLKVQQDRVMFYVL